LPSPAYERQKDIVHDLCDRLFRDGQQGHQHLVPQQVKRRRSNARRKAVRIDLAAFDAPAQHLIYAKWLLPAAQELRAQVGRRPSSFGEVLAPA